MLKSALLALLFLIMCFSLSEAQETATFVCTDRTPSTDADFKQWAGRDVSVVITTQERNAFEKLETGKDQLAFIDQFWIRRDPDPDTTENEFKVEYCDRIRKAQRFQSGIPGWKTDRGRILLLWGEPSRIEKGRISVGSLGDVPFEKWAFDHIDGLGGCETLLFIDPTETNEYRLSDDDVKRLTPIVDSYRRGLTIQIGGRNDCPTNNTP